jgi:glycerate kinase
MILVAPTSFKGTLSNSQVAGAVAAAVRGRDHVVVRPLSDGGPGLIEALQAVQAGSVSRVAVRGPYGEEVLARVFEQDTRVVIESADACGIHLTSRRSPLDASTFGVGQLVNHAASFSKPIGVGLGGSATVDGGAGMRDALRAHADIIALCDVDTSLFDAPLIFGPQKGASLEDVAVLERRLRELAGNDPAASAPGSGAAGGLGYGLHAFAGATLVRGSDWVIQETGLDELLRSADVVITGEGAFDAQSSMGKITGEVIRRARGRVILIAGSVEGKVPDQVRAIAGGPNLTLDDVARLASEALSA